MSNLNDLKLKALLQGTGVISAGLFTGLSLSWPLLWLRPLLNQNSNLNKIKLLHGSYNEATRVMPTLSLFSAISYAFATKSITNLPGILIFSVIPFTGLFIHPHNDKMFAKESREFLENDPNADKALKKWMKLHTVRIVLSLASTITGFYEFYKFFN